MQKNELLSLFNALSLDEKIGELVQLSSVFFSGGNITGPVTEYGMTEEEIHRAGSCLSITGAETLRKIQDEHLAKHPHKIPMLFMADIINGYHTVYPIPLAQGCSFDPELVEKCAEMAAREAASAGLHVTFSPMADLVRDARWGRVMESTGEDPCLNARLAEAMVRGYQGERNQLQEKGRLAACLKHFAGYGAPEGGREYHTVELSVRTLREEYLPAYAAAVRAGCALVMSSFNTLDRIPSSANRWLMRDVLRGEMGFRGVTISDWNAIGELVPHGVAADLKDAAALAMEAGIDMDMTSPAYYLHLKNLIQEGTLSMELVDEAVLRVLELKNALGLFENPYKDGNVKEEAELLLCESHRMLARRMAEESFVLLKNEGNLLPLDSHRDAVAFIGPYGENRLLCGAWSLFADDEKTVSVREGVETLYPDAKAFFAPGCAIEDPDQTLIGFGKPLVTNDIDSERAMAEAIHLASTADRVVLLLGEHRERTGECASRGNITLPKCQMELLRQVKKVNPHICVVLFQGRPLEIRELNELAEAVLIAWLPGTEGGHALARMLYGDAVPSGRLSMCIPYAVGQVPLSYHGLNTGRPLQGDYRKQRSSSQYLDMPNAPLYPFGYGLGYTSFSYSPVRLNQTVLQPGGELLASVSVTNTGNRIGRETVQLYLRDLVGSVSRPVRELKDFKKITLEPGESAEVTFTIREEMLRFYDIEMRYRSEPGEFHLFIGPDSTTDHGATFTLLPEQL